MLYKPHDHSQIIMHLRRICIIRFSFTNFICILKLKTIHIFFPAPIKGRAQFYTSSHSNSTNTCEVTMQVKRAIGKATVHKLPIFNEYISPHYFAWFVVCFPIVVKAILHDPYVYNLLVSTWRPLSFKSSWIVTLHYFRIPTRHMSHPLEL